MYRFLPQLLVLGLMFTRFTVHTLAYIGVIKVEKSKEVTPGVKFASALLGIVLTVIILYLGHFFDQLLEALARV